MKTKKFIMRYIVLALLCSMSMMTPKTGAAQWNTITYNFTDPNFRNAVYAAICVGLFGFIPKNLTRLSIDIALCCFYFQQINDLIKGKNIVYFVILFFSCTFAAINIFL